MDVPMIVVSTDGDDQENTTPVSVRDRLQQFHKLSSETDLTVPRQASLRGKREGRMSHANAELSEFSESAISMVSLDGEERIWMVECSRGDYAKMHRMLMDNPMLATFRDFTNGYTALHWAAKQGKTDIVKMLMKNRADPNAKSHGGFTPLHLSAMHERYDVIELLTKSYGANPNLRDYGGKRPKNYLNKDCPARVQQYLQGGPGHQRQSLAATGTLSASEDSNGKHGDTSSSFSFNRSASFSAKVRKTKQAIARSFRGSSSGAGGESNGSADGSPSVRRRSKPQPSEVSFNRPMARRRSGSLPFLASLGYNRLGKGQVSTTDGSEEGGTHGAIPGSGAVPAFDEVDLRMSSFDREAYQHSKVLGEVVGHSSVDMARSAYGYHGSYLHNADEEDTDLVVDLTTPRGCSDRENVPSRDVAIYKDNTANRPYNETNLVSRAVSFNQVKLGGHHPFCSPPPRPRSSLRNLFVGEGKEKVRQIGRPSLDSMDGERSELRYSQLFLSQHGRHHDGDNNGSKSRVKWADSVLVAQDVGDDDDDVDSEVYDLTLERL